MIPRKFVKLMACAAMGVAVLVVPATSRAQTGTIGLNFTGVTVTQGMSLNSNGGYAPPDSDGAVGPNNIAQLINGAYAVYDKSGHQQELISGRQFWINAGVDPGNAISNLGAFNARIVFDPTSGRWIAAELTGTSANNKVLIAASNTSDPTGGWHAVAIAGNPTNDGTFVDYTRLGVDANGVYVSTNNFASLTSSDGIDSVSIFSLPKASLLAGTTANLTRFDALDPNSVGVSMQPIINFSPLATVEPILATSFNDPDSVLLRTSISGTTGAGAHLSTPTSINVPEYTSPPPVAQPGSGGDRTVGAIDARFSGNVYQVGNTIYAAQAITTDAGNAGITWYKIDATTNAVIQQGTLSSADFDYFQPSIAANANGNIVIGFTRSGFGPGGNLSDYAAVATTVGGVTTFGSPFLLQASTIDNDTYFGGRWGDYTTTVVDPSNPNVFWTFQEYATAANPWATQITEITVPEPSTIVLAAIAIVVGALLAARRRAGMR